MNPHSVFIVQMAGSGFGAIDAAMLSARAAKANLQMREVALQITLYVRIHEFIHAIEEREDLAILLQEIDDRLIQPRLLLILLVATGVIRAAAVKHITATIAAGILRNATLETETIDCY